MFYCRVPTNLTRPILKSVIIRVFTNVLLQGTYKLNQAHFKVDVDFIPAGDYRAKVDFIPAGDYRAKVDFIPAGDYRAKVDLHYGSKQVYCLEISVTLS